MERFYAKFKGYNNEILIFDSEAARDAWVKYEDEFSRDMGTTPNNAIFKRITITETKALALAGDAFNNKNNFYLDEINKCIVLCFTPRIPKEVLEEFRYKILLDKFAELKAVLTSFQK